MNLNNMINTNDASLYERSRGAANNDQSLQGALYREAVLNRGSAPSFAEAVVNQQRLDGAVAIPAAFARASQSNIETAMTDRERTDRIEKLRPRVRQHVLNAIASIPILKKEAYLEVIKKSPNLPEADPMAWVRRWDFNIWKAAETMVAYWQERKDIFGPDRFHLPLDLSGKGALGETEIKQIMAGYPIVIMDESTNQKFGLFDRRNVLATSNANVLLRALFYACSLLAEEERAQAETLKCIFQLVSPLEYPLDKEYGKRALDILATAMPIKTTWLILADLKNPILDTILSEQCISCFTNWFTADAVKIFNHAKTIEEQQQALLDEGFSTSCIPTTFGGKWTPESSAAWIVKHDLQRQRDYNVRQLTNTRTGIPPSETGSFAHQNIHLAMPAVAQIQAFATQPGMHHSSIGGFSSMIGNSRTTFPATSVSNKEYIENFAKAMQAVPKEEKLAYLEALRKCPELVKAESDPMRFIRFCDFDMKAAAERLALYWQGRLKLFGNDRAFLPMILSGSGAFDKNDTACLFAGYPAILPNTEGGKKAVVFDRRRWSNMNEQTLRPKSAFYLFNLLSEDSRTQTEGIEVLILLKFPMELTWSERSFNRTVKLIAKSMPVKLNIHLALWSDSETQFPMMRSLAFPGLSTLLRWIPFTSIKFHTERNEGQIYRELREYGFTHDGIPAELGGTWNFAGVEAFYRDLDKNRRDLNKSMLGQAALHYYVVAGEMSDQSEESKDRNSSRPLATEEDNIITLEPILVTPEEHSFVRTRIYEGLQKVIESMEDRRKTAYMHAIQKAPLVVEKETDFLQFVRCCDYNLEYAALRLVSYWQERLECFGAENAFLPLLLNGKGALNSQESSEVKAGFPAVLADSALGKKVALIDGRQWLPGSDNRTHLRCIFYVFAMLAEDLHSQSDGVSCVMVATAPRLEPQDEGYFRCLCRILSKAIPVKIHWHLVNIPPKSGVKRLYEVQDDLASKLDIMLEYFPSDHIDVHFERQPGHVVSDLEEFGMTKNDLPIVIGGKWKMEDFAMQCQSYDTAKRELYSQIPLPRRTRSTTQEEKRAKRRIIELIQSRRKRERKQLHTEMMREEKDKLVVEQRLLLAERARLESLKTLANETLTRFRLDLIP